MKKADIQVGTIYRYSPQSGTAGLAVVLSVTDQYGAGDKQGYPAVLAGPGYGIDPQRLDGITLAQFEVAKGADDPLAPRRLRRLYLSTSGTAAKAAAIISATTTVFRPWPPRRASVSWCYPPEIRTGFRAVVASGRARIGDPAGG